MKECNMLVTIQPRNIYFQYFSGYASKRTAKHACLRKINNEYTIFLESFLFKSIKRKQNNNTSYQQLNDNCGVVSQSIIVRGYYHELELSSIRLEQRSSQCQLTIEAIQLEMSLRSVTRHYTIEHLRGVIINSLKNKIKVQSKQTLLCGICQISFCHSDHHAKP